MLPGRRVTLLIIPEEGGGTYELKVPRMLIWVCLILAICTVGLLGIGLRSWMANEHLTQQVERLQRDKAILAEDVTLIEELENVLEGLEKSNLRLRSMAANAVGLDTRVLPVRTSRTREQFISIQRRLELGGLRTVPTMSPVVLSSWRALDKGVMLEAPQGSLVQVAAAGLVERIGYDRDLGYTVFVDHGNGVQSRYAGLGTLIVEANDFVQKAQPLGLLGWPRNGASPGVRFTISENGRDRTSDFRSLWL
ncbi:MAG: M23 family metallopeptidase [bacterium]|nr:M23 family metallopeptidase [bacterium]